MSGVSRVFSPFWKSVCRSVWWSVCLSFSSSERWSDVSILFLWYVHLISSFSLLLTLSPLTLPTFLSPVFSSSLSISSISFSSPLSYSACVRVCLCVCVLSTSLCLSVCGRAAAIYKCIRKS